MGFREKFSEKVHPTIIDSFTKILADEAIIEKQSCPNWRCRGNVDYHCVYHKEQYDICGDKDAVNDDFFKYD
ncbi:unnamed protein product [marine sediment metagenome]|uniref:Uncharacterized protein n=1 Tax=marine sediment metagenome TaxID=412755 RepID=X0T1D5_9ZZZZ